MTHIEATVWNSGDVACTGVRVDAFLHDSLTASPRFLGSTRLDLPAKQKALAAIPGFFGRGVARLRLIVDSENLFVEADEDNNLVEIALPVDRYAITPELGSSAWGTCSDTLDFESGFRLFVPPGSATASTVVKM